MEPASADIQLLSESRSHCLFVRDEFAALVERTAGGYGSIGSTGVWTERGLAYLVWRDGEAYLAGKGFEQRATEEQVAAVRQFEGDADRVTRISRTGPQDSIYGLRAFEHACYIRVQ